MSNVQKGETHRLENLEVKEVSLVTRGANKRTFAIVKSADAALVPIIDPPPVAVDLNGIIAKDETPAVTGAVTADASTPPADPVAKTEAAAPSEPAQKTETSDTPAAPEGSPAAAPISTEKTDLPVTPDLVSPAAAPTQEVNAVVAAVASPLGDVAKRFSDMLTAIAQGKMTGDAGAITVASEISAISQSLSVLSLQMNPQQRAANPYELSLAKTDAATPPDAPDEVRKLGAKMAKERLERMRNAIQTLHDIIAELSAEEATTPAPEGVFAAKSDALNVRDEQVSSELRSMRLTLEESLKKSQILEADIKNNQAQQQKLDTENAELRKKVDEQAAAMAALAKSRTSSNALPVDSTNPVLPNKEAEVSWGWDLNSSNGRHATKKEHLFSVDGK